MDGGTTSILGYKYLGSQLGNSPGSAFQPRVNPSWHLPEVVSIEAVRVHFKKPVLHSVGPKLTESREAVELRVRTIEEFPVRALSPALFVGDVVVNEYSAVDKHLYHFISYETQRLRPGTPISRGWYGTATKKKTKTKFRLELLREETR